MLVVTIFVRSSYNNQADFSYADYVTSSLRRERGGGVGGGGGGGGGGVVGAAGGGQMLRIRLFSHVVGGATT